MANVKCQAIETSILLENNNSFAGTLIIGTFEKRAPGLERREKKETFRSLKMERNDNSSLVCSLLS